MAVPLQIDQRLGGRYRLEQPIGYGGMGRVYRAIDELLDRPVAIKLLDRAGPDLPEMAEARAAARLSHPGVVHVFDVGVADGEAQGYIVMELVPGQSLREILRERGQLSIDEAAELAAQLADALDAIHHLDMVHCDVKPLNIIVTPSGHAKLIDFGIARAATAAAGDPLGSAAYVAPEQALGQPLDGRADVYALGAVLYEMLVGSPPFKGTNPNDVVRRRLEGDPPRPRSVDPRVPRELEAIVMRALARDPAQRHATAAELHDALRAFIAHAAEPTQPLEVIAPGRAPNAKLARGSSPSAAAGSRSTSAPGTIPSSTSGSVASSASPSRPRSSNGSPRSSAPRASAPAVPGSAPSSSRRSGASSASHTSARSMSPASRPPDAGVATARRPVAASARSSVMDPVHAPRLAVAVAAVVLIAWMAAAGWRITHPTVNVPHLVGLQLSEVPTTLEQAGIAPADVTVLTRQVEPRYVGTVVDQQPQPGQPRSSDGVQIAIGVGP